MKSDKEKTAHTCAESEEAILDSMGSNSEKDNIEEIAGMVSGQAELDSIVYRETSDLLADAKGIIDSGKDIAYRSVNFAKRCIKKNQKIY